MKELDSGHGNSASIPWGRPKAPRRVSELLKSGKLGEPVFVARALVPAGISTLADAGERQLAFAGLIGRHRPKAPRRVSALQTRVSAPQKAAAQDYRRPRRQECRRGTQECVRHKSSRHKITGRVLVLVWLLLMAAAPLCAQRAMRFDLANGTAVRYEAWDGYTPQLGELRGDLYMTFNAVRRTIRDEKGRVRLAFDVHVEPVGKGSVRLYFSPVAGAPFFAQAPSSREVPAGDHILLEVMEQAATGRKLYDSLRVGFHETAMELPPMPPDGPAVITSGTLLRLDQATLHEAGTLLAKNSGSQSGTMLRMAFPNGGEYTLSSVPGPGYRLEAIIYGGLQRTRAAFADGGLLYNMDCASPIVNQPGSWMAWVKCDLKPHEAPGKGPVPKGGPAVPELKIWPILQ